MALPVLSTLPGLLRSRTLLHLEILTLCPSPRTSLIYLLHQLLIPYVSAIRVWPNKM
jgi:hypothetical protein